MRKKTTTRWDAADHLRSEADMARYLGAQLNDVDAMRRADLWVIFRRLDAENRLKQPGATERAADLAFTLSTPTVYEDQCLV